VLAAAFDRAHMLWFDEPCQLSNLAAENVTPVGFGRIAGEAGVFQDLLRSDAIDVIRANIARHGIPRIRRISAVEVGLLSYADQARTDFDLIHLL
jgi:L-alanine-DL-glutamate epimerase-like enolase superfamily enzyme